MCVLMPAGLKLLPKRDVSLDRGLIPKIYFVQPAGELVQILGSIEHAMAVVVDLRPLLIGSLAVEQLDDPPLFECETKNLVCAANQRDNYRLSILNIFSPHHCWIEPRISDSVSSGR